MRRIAGLRVFPSFAAMVPAVVCAASRFNSGGRGAALQDNRKPGDWTCPNCASNNFSRRTACFSCSLPKPAELRAFTAFEQHGGRQNTAAGAAGEEGDAVPVEGIEIRRSLGTDKRSRAGSPVKKGDWVCRKCSAHNFAFRSSCLDCGYRRPSFEPISQSNAPIPRSRREQGVGRGRGGDGEGIAAEPQPTLRALTDREELLFGELAAPGLPPPKPGDWRCAECQFVNFASRATCKTCGNAISDDNNLLFTDADISELLLRRRQASGHGGRRPSLSTSGGSGSHRVLAGDWSCQQCSYSNFASRAHCNRCGFGRPAHTAQSPHSDDSVPPMKEAAKPRASDTQQKSDADRQRCDADGLESMLSEVLGSGTQ